MGEWRYSSTIFNFGTRWRRVVSFIDRKLYSLMKSHQYPLDTRLAGPQNPLGLCGKREDSLVSVWN
jgi:hypothetical protein